MSLHEPFFDLIHRFHVDVNSRLGVGAFSEVWRAVDRTLPDNHPNKIVALKRIKPLSAANRIYEEAEFLNELNGDHHVIELLDILNTDGLTPRAHHTLVLRYCPHTSFKDYYTKLSLREVQHYMRALLESFDYLHSRPSPIVHRDLKPANWLYQPPWQRKYHSREDCFALVDFGLAHRQCDEASKKAERVKKRRAKAMMTATTTTITSANNEGTAGRESAVQLTKRIKLAPTAIREALTIENTRNRVPASSLHHAHSHPQALSHQSRSQLTLLTSRSKSALPLPHASTLGTKGFRAPEILLRQDKRRVTSASDLWNIGVIFLCLLCHRYPFFTAGDSEEALVQMMRVLGLIKPEHLKDWSELKVTFTHSHLEKCGEDGPHRCCMNTLGDSVGESGEPMHLSEFAWLSTGDKCWPSEAIDLAYQLLHYDPYTRISASQALRHPFLTKDYDESDARQQWASERRASVPVWEQRAEERRQRWKTPSAPVNTAPPTSGVTVSEDRTNASIANTADSSCLSGAAELSERLNYPYRSFHSSTSFLTATMASKPAVALSMASHRSSAMRGR